MNKDEAIDAMMEAGVDAKIIEAAKKK